MKLKSYGYILIIMSLYFPYLKYENKLIVAHLTFLLRVQYLNYFIKKLSWLN